MDVCWPYGDRSVHVECGTGGALLAKIRSVTDRPVTLVINTHYHRDHVAGNRVFVEAGATVLAHRNVHGWIHRENLRCGDLIWRDMVPNMIDGSTKPWIATLDALVTAYPGYTFVPGHGDVASAEQVRGFRDYLSTLQKFVMDAKGKNPSSEAIAAAVMPPLAAKFGKWDGFQYLAPENIAQMVDELDGMKPVPQPVN